LNEVAKIVRDHVAKAKLANTHQAKLLVLSNLLEELFQVKLEELIPGIETKLGSKMLGLRGSADLLFSNRSSATCGLTHQIAVPLQAL